jgi:pyridoxamine 5'-phosphate oxidase
LSTPSEPSARLASTAHAVFDPHALEFLSDPIEQFRRWQAEWERQQPEDPTAAVLATVDANAQPSARAVRVAYVDVGFVFFTSYSSRKALALATNPRASLCFAWIAQARQVRVDGTAMRLDELASDLFFSTLPRSEQLLAWASDQRRALARRTDLAERIGKFDDDFLDQEVPRPRHWGGFRLLPGAVEFLETRDDGCDLRVRYRRPSADAPWSCELLTP